MKHSNFIKLDKKDHLRALLSDTSPSDTPIIYSNDGLYINIKTNNGKLSNNVYNPTVSFLNKLLSPINSGIGNYEDRLSKQKKQSSPYKYKIIKNEISLRTLSLIHPRSQLNYCDFYKEYASAISYHSSLSPFSIRSPHKVASSFFSRNIEPTNKYKDTDIDTLENELVRKYASSYFTYKGFNRIHKLYDSNKYIELEKKFNKMWKLDVSTCFDSIYTHTISWAIKNKEYIKSRVQYINQFPQQLDTLMQRSNNNETNGIPIGSEFSRVFSELIFQRIDRNIEIKIRNKYKYEHNRDYVILRYVDDFIIFSKSNEISECVFNIITDSLKEYNLSLNESKIEKYDRPFCTNKSALIIKLKRLLSEFDSLLFHKSKDLMDKNMYINEIRSSSAIKRYFINNVKTILLESNLLYGDLSSYLISSLSKRLFNLMDLYDNDLGLEKIKEKEKRKELKDVIIILLDLMLFYYSVHPHISSSYKISKSIAALNHFFNDILSEYSDIFKVTVVSSIDSLNFIVDKKNDIEGYVAIEKLNLILATNSFGDNYTVNVDYFNNHFKDNHLSYFSIVSILFYIKNRADYRELKKLIEENIIERFDSQDLDLTGDSENCHLFLDILSCPYISIEVKERIYTVYLAKYEADQNRSESEIEDDLSVLSNIYWFTKWSDLDLVRLIEKKELKYTY